MNEGMRMIYEGVMVDLGSDIGALEYFKRLGEKSKGSGREFEMGIYK